MYNGDVGGVSGGGNVQWNKKLAEELDAADGNKDGKISANIWNGFLNKTGSSGNKIKNFINLNNAEKSFNFYEKKKDAGKVDWSNWQELLNNFKKEQGLHVEDTKVDPQTDPKVETKTEPKIDSKPDLKVDPKNDNKTDVTPEQQTEFDNLVKSGALDEKPYAAEALKEGGFGAKSSGLAFQQDENGLYYALDKNGGRTYINDKGESIRISEFEAQGVDGGKVEVTYTSEDGKTKNHIIYGEDDKPIKGFTSVEGENWKDTTYYMYEYDSAGKKVLKEVKAPKTDDNGLEPGSPEKFDVEQLLSESVKNGFKLESDKDGVRIYLNDEGSKITVTKEKDGSTTMLNESSDGAKFKRIINKDGYLVQTSDIKKGLNTGKEIEIRRNYYKDGSIEKTSYVDGVKMDDFDYGEFPAIGELQFMVKNSPAKLINSKFPTEEELLKAGYKKNESLMSGNGGVLYENSQTGDSIVVTEFDHSIEYRNGNMRQHQSYDKDGNITGGKISESSGNGAFKIYEYNTSDNGKLQVVSSTRQDAPTSNIEFAADAFDGHSNSIAEFKKSLGCPEDLSFELPPLTTNVENYHGETNSADGNYSIKVDIDVNGNVKIIYAKKQADGTFKDIGVINLKKAGSPGSLRGYDYSFESEDLVTGNKNTKSNASWPEGN